MLIVIIIWICIGLGLSMIGIHEASKAGVGKHNPDLSYRTNEIINFMTVGIMMLVGMVLGPLLLFLCFKKK